MRRFSAAACFLAAVVVAGPTYSLKRVPYPEVLVTALPAFDADAGLAEMRKRLADAVTAKDLPGVVTMLSPKFEWTATGGLVDEFDPKRGAEHNFKVAFGFRAPGRDADGTTDIGPQWELLSFFATDPVLTQEKGSPLVCGTTTAKVADMGALDGAFNRIDEADELSEWVYFVGELELTAEPGGASITKVKSLALPILGVHPPAKEGAASPSAPTHFELMLPTGKTGWAPVDRVRPLFVDRLCFTRLGSEWKIAVYEQAE